ncbi:Hypothetical predicted protein [Olea europaea subsp. europaea]|uniref:Uncharacterized protein n=1 Tax=Olea europaea subsp. europaea TaxID=158383 RepID=A0A8S0TFV5_OLEEU|nr:Hypothetical predicted protein [Olea europaea subsp. europaea]
MTSWMLEAAAVQRTAHILILTGAGGSGAAAGVDCGVVGRLRQRGAGARGVRARQQTAAAGRRAAGAGGRNTGLHNLPGCTDEKFLDYAWSGTGVLHLAIEKANSALREGIGRKPKAGLNLAKALAPTLTRPGLTLTKEDGSFTFRLFVTAFTETSLGAGRTLLLM